MATCTKTGAAVFFVEYAAWAAADLFDVADTVVINFTTLLYDEPTRTITHTVIIGTQGWLHEDKRVAVVPRHYITEYTGDENV